VSATMASDATMSRDFDYRWQQVFALSGLVGVVLCLVAWELCFPQPPDFTMSGPQTAQFYASHQTGMLIGITLSSIGMPFLIGWTIQLGAMLRRLEGGSGLVAIVATVGTVSIPILLAFDCAVWAIAAYRPETTSPDVTRAFSDLGWISSMLIWPPLAAGMALTGVIIFKSRRIRPATHHLLQKRAVRAGRRWQLVPGGVHLGALDHSAEHSNVEDARPTAQAGNRRPHRRTRPRLTNQNRARTPAGAGHPPRTRNPGSSNTGSACVSIAPTRPSAPGSAPGQGSSLRPTA
jgi:hypothetical protein